MRYRLHLLFVCLISTHLLFSHQTSGRVTMQEIGYEVFGSGEKKVLMLHNWFGDSTSFSPLKPYLDTTTFTYVFMDLRGYGKSKDIKGVYSVTEATRDALYLVQHLGWTNYHVVGHSMSGMIAQKIALDDPDHVKSLVAISPVPACGSPKPPEIMAFLTEAATTNTELAVTCVQMLTSHRYSPFFAEQMVEKWHATSTPEARLGYLDMYSNTDFSKAAPGLLTPMLIIYGDCDLEGEEKLLSSTFLKWYPNASLQCCKGAGHFSPQETPIFIASRIETFFAA